MGDGRWNTDSSLDGCGSLSHVLVPFCATTKLRRQIILLTVLWYKISVNSSSCFLCLLVSWSVFFSEECEGTCLFWMPIGLFRESIALVESIHQQSRAQLFNVVSGKTVFTCNYSSKLRGWYPNATVRRTIDDVSKCFGDKRQMPNPWFADQGLLRTS